MKVTIAAHSNGGQNSNLPAAAACSTTGATPLTSGMSPTSTAIHSRPTTMTVICTRVVSATDHMPPNRV